MERIITEIKQVLKYTLLASIIGYIIAAIQITVYYIDGGYDIDYLRYFLAIPVFGLFSVILTAYVIFPIIRLFEI